MASFPTFSDPQIIDPYHYASTPSRQWATYEEDYDFGGHYEVVQSTRMTMSNPASHGLSSMERFFGWYDESPFTANPFHSSLKRLEISGASRAPNQNTFPRCGSPADTASSANSNWTQNHSEVPADYIGGHSVHSQTSHSPSMMSCDGYEASPICQAQYLQGGGCVSLNSIQQFPDQTQDEVDDCATSDHGALHIPYEGKYEQYGIKPACHDSHHEGEDLDEQPSMTDQENSDQPEADHDEEGSDPEYKPHIKVSIAGKRPRRRTSQLSNGSTQGNKRSPRGRKDSLGGPVTGRVEKSKAKPNKTAGGLLFPCPLARYGCQSSFTSKNEWKRHVSTQHIKLIYWRCDLCPLSSDPKNPTFNDFNRKDLFTQHLRRMHAKPDINGQQQAKPVSKAVSNAALLHAIPEDEVAAHQKRCCQELRTLPPSSSCLFCPRTFSGNGSWLERMDHIGAHLEKDRKASASVADYTAWHHDAVLEAWLVDEGLIARNDRGRWALGDGVPLRLRLNTR